jgi:hypothetical protein
VGKPGEGSEELLNSIRPGYVSFVINTRTVLSGMHYGNGVAIRPALRSTTLIESPIICLPRRPIPSIVCC